MWFNEIPRRCWEFSEEFYGVVGDFKGSHGVLEGFNFDLEKFKEDFNVV